MTPPFFFDFTIQKPTDNLCNALSAPSKTKLKPTTEPANSCPYPIPTLDGIIKKIERSVYQIDKHMLLSSLFECGAIAISNAVDKTQFHEREERYLQIINGYKPDEQKLIVELFSDLFALLSSVVYDNGKFYDYLGELFMHCNQGNKHAGQFFTPYHISECMARVTLDETTVREKAADDGIITVNDPCCGGGGLLLAALDVLKSYNVNYARNCFILASDIDIRCVHMTYLQLSLAGVPAVVLHQNSLTQETWSVWKSPAYILQYPRFYKLFR